MDFSTAVLLIVSPQISIYYYYSSLREEALEACSGFLPSQYRSMLPKDNSSNCMES